MSQKFVRITRSLLSFTHGERRGVLLLIPLFVVVTLLMLFANRQQPQRSLIEESDATADSIISSIHSTAGHYNNTEQLQENTDYETFAFDPNTVTYRELLRLGMSKRSAAGFVKYRTAGKIFGVKEEFAASYGVSEQMYDRLEPYIIIGAKWRTKPRFGNDRYSEEHTQHTDLERDSLFRFDPNKLSIAEYELLGFTPRQAEAIVKYRKMVGGFRDLEQFAKCYMVTPEKLAQLQPYIEFAIAKSNAPSSQLVEINTADSAELCLVHGIGAVSARAIVEYRQRLGGFVSMAQLAEISSVRERNFESICKQIWVDSCEIQKIDVNFATPKQLNEQLTRHPYCGAVALRKLLKQRQLKGGWRSIGDMTEQNILTPSQAEKLAPYLLFSTTVTQKTTEF